MMAGYHLTNIPKGILGDWSKVEEEYAECIDSMKQKNKLMALVEISDLLGALDAYVRKQSNESLTLDDILKMTEATKKAFISGARK
jgi:hypothetical protein